MVIIAIDVAVDQALSILIWILIGVLGVAAALILCLTLTKVFIVVNCFVDILTWWYDIVLTCRVSIATATTSTTYAITIPIGINIIESDIIRVDKILFDNTCPFLVKVILIFRVLSHNIQIFLLVRMLLWILYLLNNGWSVYQLRSKTLTPQVLLQKPKVILVADVSIIIEVHWPEQDLKVCRCRFELEKGKGVVNGLHELFLTHQPLRPFWVYFLAM